MRRSTAIFDHKLAWFGTLRGRFGTAFTPDALAYITGGVVVGDIKTAGTVCGLRRAGNPRQLPASAITSRSAGWTDRRSGSRRIWSAIGPASSISLHGLRLDPDRRRPSAPDATVAAFFNSRLTDNVVRLGINYKFDRSAAIVAKYSITTAA